MRLVIARLIDEEGWIVAQWTLLTNAVAESADAAQIALWYYWRWRLESFFKLLKSHGQEVEYWQQESGIAITRSLLERFQVPCSVASTKSYRGFRGRFCTVRTG